MTSVTLKTTKTQHKTAHGDTLPEAALQTREAAGRSGALVSAAARPPLAPCPGLRLHSGPSVQAARLCCWGRRGGRSGKPRAASQAPGPSRRPFGGPRGFLSRAVRGRGTGRPAEAEVGRGGREERGTLRKAPGRGGVCEGAAPAGAGAPGAETPEGAQRRLLAHWAQRENTVTSCRRDSPGPAVSTPEGRVQDRNAV